jgi:hypothetical protein
MSEERKIGDLPASDKELNEEGRSGSARPAAPPEARDQPTSEGTQPSPGGSDAQRSSPPPPDPGEARRDAYPNPGDPEN